MPCSAFAAEATWLNLTRLRIAILFESLGAQSDPRTRTRTRCGHARVDLDARACTGVQSGALAAPAVSFLPTAPRSRRTHRRFNGFPRTTTSREMTKPCRRCTCCASTAANQPRSRSSWRSGRAYLFWIHPEALEAGARYRLEVDDGDCVTAPVEFEVASSQPLPQALGELSLSDPQLRDVRVATGSGSCDTPIPAVAIDVDLELDDDTKPWSALLQYRTIVDDEPWAPSWSLGPEPPDLAAGARNLIFSECPDNARWTSGRRPSRTRRGRTAGPRRSAEDEPRERRAFVRCADPNTRYASRHPR